MFRKVLVANRGEIAVRIQQSLQAMGLSTVAIFSDPDREAPHVAMANEAWPLHGVTAAETYLDIEKVVRSARDSGAEAVHPGYGFLSENPRFARACEESDLVFIGPTPQSMELLGDKGRAKELAAAAGAPVVPSRRLDRLDPPALRQAANQIGFPLLAKAVAGGGGRGMRLIEYPHELEGAVAAAAREAEAAFSSGAILLEKYIPRARHVEVQILGDRHGEVVHLFERECSIQRRHQKLVEESPSPALDGPLRKSLHEAALAIGKAAGYRNAGTVEFIVGEDGRFYFLEVNTRLQVEHPVTEAVLGIDLVRQQVRLAAGEPLDPGLQALQPRGHAIECRIYAEDPYHEFAPAAGELLVWSPPSGPGIRVDSGVTQGNHVTTNYDALLGKLITWGETRPDAMARAEWALRHFPILGVATTIPLLTQLFRHPDFKAGMYHTGFLPEHPELFQPAPDGDTAGLAAALALWGASKSAAPTVPSNGRAAERSPWLQGGAWRLGQ